MYPQLIYHSSVDRNSKPKPRLDSEMREGVSLLFMLYSGVGKLLILNSQRLTLLRVVLLLQVLFLMIKKHSVTIASLL